MQRRTKQNGFDFGVTIGGQQQQSSSSSSSAPPPLARPGSNNRFSQNQQQQQQRPQQQPDLTSAIESALRNGNLHIANRGIIALPWLKMFPKTEEEIEEELKEEEEKRKQRMMVGDGKPHPHNTIARFGRRRVDHSVSLDMSSAANQLKWWEGHPIVQLDCSSNSLESLVDDFDDIEKKHDDRFERLGENLKLLQCSRNSISSLPAFVGFSALALLDISRNQLSGDLTSTLINGSQQQMQQMANNNNNNNFVPPLLPSLVELNASQNNFTSAHCILDILAPDLRILRMNNNKLQKFSLVSLNNNQDIVVIKISSLREVDLSYNRLSVAPFLFPSSSTNVVVAPPPELLLCSHPCLETLDLSFNQEFLNVNPDLAVGKFYDNNNHPEFSQHMSKLRSLNLRHSGLSSLSVFSCPELREINASENRILSFPSIDVSSRAQLSSIDLAGNKLNSLDALVSIPPNSSNNNNYIDENGNSQVVGANNVAALFPNLERLDVTNNDLNSIPPRICLLPKLRNMTLNGNPIRTIRRELLAKNTTELKAYLRSRLDERENDESAIANSKALKVQEAMEKTLQQQQQQQQGEDVNGLANTNPSAFGFHNNNSNQQQQPQQQSLPRQQQQQQQAPAILQPIGSRQGNLWDLSYNNSSSNSSLLPANARTSRGLVPAARQFRQSQQTSSSGAGGLNSGANNNVPLLPETLVAACILDVSPHTQEHVSQCTKLNLSGQTRLRQISLDFFGELVPQLTDLDVSRTNLSSLREILGEMNFGAPLQLKTLVASKCSLQGPWPIEWCRPLSGEQQVLAHLDVSSNGLTSLPEEFGLAVCWSLRHLNLSHNRINQLPRALLHLRHLSELLYSSNGLLDSSLQQFGDLSQYWPSLNTFDVSFNELRSIHLLPNAFGGFNANNLRALKLEGNGIRFLSTHLIEGPVGPLLSALRDRMVK